MDKKPKMVNLSAPSPDMRDSGGDWSVSFPENISEDDYNFLRERLEHRRKCMNQGFDNLLELLTMHWQYFKDASTKTRAE